MASFVRKTPVRASHRTLTLGNDVSAHTIASRGDTRLPAGWWLVPACLLGAGLWILIFWAIWTLL